LNVPAKFNGRFKRAFGKTILAYVIVIGIYGILTMMNDG
jgi:hypothetical protein